MTKSKTKALAIERLSDDRQLTIPQEYRDALSLTGDSSLIVVRVGDALVRTPADDALAAVTERLEARLRAAGSGLDDLLRAAAEARAAMVREEFGETSTR
jgi:bifunctional DNA-binding transcriptional regulator/antitoxin component of YhaV-PrlF toxin-antitoxin module